MTSQNSSPLLWTKEHLKKWLLGLDPSIHPYIDKLLSFSMPEFLQIIKTRNNYENNIHDNYVLSFMRYAPAELLYDALEKLDNYQKFIQYPKNFKKEYLDYLNFCGLLNKVLAEFGPDNSSNIIKTLDFNGTSVDLFIKIDKILNNSKIILSQIDKFLAKCEVILNEYNGIPYLTPGNYGPDNDMKIMGLSGKSINENFISEIVVTRGKFLDLVIRLSKQMDLFFQGEELELNGNELLVSVFGILREIEWGEDLYYFLSKIIDID